MLENMKNRRTIRKYTTQDIPDALLNELLEVAVRASNTKPVSILPSTIPWPPKR